MELTIFKKDVVSSPQAHSLRSARFRLESVHSGAGCTQSPGLKRLYSFTPSNRVKATLEESFFPKLDDSHQVIFASWLSFQTDKRLETPATGLNAVSRS